MTYPVQQSREIYEGQIIAVREVVDFLQKLVAQRSGGLGAE